MASPSCLTRTLVAAAAIVATACGDTGTRTVPPPTPATLERIDISPAVAMVAKGSTVALSAQAVFSDGKTEDVTATAVWASSAAAVATVTDQGVVRGVGVGTSDLRATFDTKVGMATVSVTAAPLLSVAVAPRSATLDVGANTTLTARGTFADGTTEDVSSRVEWATSSATVATVSGGLVTGVGGGSATIAVRDAVTMSTDRATITVRPRIPTSIAVAPSGVTLPLGRNQPFTATAVFADGVRTDATTQVTWSSSNPAVAAVDASGLATSVAEGLTSITAAYPGGPRGSTTLAVGPAALEVLAVTPSTATVASGQSQTYRAEARYSNGTVRDLTFVATWSSSNPNVATMNRNVAMPVGTGTTAITAHDPTSGTETTAHLRILPPALTGIVVTPSAPTIPFGSTQQLRAHGLYSDNSSQELTQTVQWQSSNPMVATVAADGLASSVGQGMTTISAVDVASGVSSAQTANGSATLTVSPPALLSIAVTPSVWAMVVGGTRAFVATGSYSDGNQADISGSVQWRSSGAAVTIAAGGLATAQSVGNVTISATDPGTMVSSDDSGGSASVSSTLAALVRIALAPTSTTVPAGAEARIRATGHYDNGATNDITEQVTWSVATTSVATILNAAGVRGSVVRTRAGSTRVIALEPGSGVSSGPGALVSVTAAPALTALTITPAVATVNVGRTLALTARGRFADGQIHRMTHTVDWSSAPTSRATVDNADGNRGRVTGVAVGMATVSAVYAATGLTAIPAAAITVELGIITAAQTWPGPVVEIDSTPEFGVNVGTVAFTAAAFAPNATITDVNVTITFLKTDGTCAAPLSGGAFHNETSFRLMGPTGTQAVLASANTWSGGTATPQITIEFDDAATMTPSATPVSGTFHPTGSLAVFNGTAPAGNWTLQAGDSAGGDPLCVYMYTVTVTAQ